MKNEKFKLSSEQELAVDINRNIAVSAGAGSGKTRVLTSRYLKLLEAGFEIEEIVSMTFTEKAALEMKERIRQAIIDEISLSEGEEKSDWMRHLDKLGRANISTIHGFCSSIIRENAAYLRIDFNFGIISETDKSLMLEEASKAAKNKVFARLEYKAILEKLAEVYGDKYITSAFLNEILLIRRRILDKGKNINDLYIDAANDSLDKFIYEMVLETDRYYSDCKLRRDLLDYNDLEIMTLRILEDKRLRERYRRRYRTLLVDEFQDTNEIQKKIIYNLAADDEGRLVPSKLFIVGDFKQSIYGFRGTDYTIFRNVAQNIGDEGKVNLSTCYRSRNEIIEGVNSIFRELIEDYEPLKCHMDVPLDEKRIKIITYNKEKSSSGNLLTEVKNLLQGKSSSFHSLDAAFEALKENYGKVSLPENRGGIAASRAIRLLLDKGLSFKDICILVRSRSAIPEIEDELKRKNVPYCIIGGGGFYKRPEVNEILNIYKVIIRGFDGEFSYEDNLNFIKSMRGPLFQIPDNVILELRLMRDECRAENLYGALSIIIDTIGEGENKEKLQRMYCTLKKLNQLKERLSVVRILKEIINECRAYEIMLCQEGGIQKYRNIEKLVHVAKAFDDEELFALDEFVEYLRLLDETGTDDSEASLDAEDSEAVKIMTIHQSKGLEFKAVIVPRIQADLLHNSKTHKRQIVFADDSIILSKDLNTAVETDEYKSYLSHELAKEVDEYKRLLYVAITRAEDYAILTGEEDEKAPVEFYDDEGKVKNLNSFLKQIKYALDVKGADNSLVEFINLESLKDLEAVDSVINYAEIDEEAVDKKLKYRCSAKPSVNVSASSFIKYKKCPRKYYIENVLRVSGRDCMNAEFAEELALEVAAPSAAELGTMVHGIIETLNWETGMNEEDAINSAIEAAGLQDMVGIRGDLKRYIDNYRLLEDNRQNLGNRIYLSNELEYNLTPHKDKKLSIIGFIDRLEVFENSDRLSAVVTDYKTNRLTDETRKAELIEAYVPQLQLYGKAGRELLYINGIKVEDTKLQLYFLDKAEKVEIPYDEIKADEQLQAMDSIFARNLNESSANEFPKRSGSCDECDYREICR